MLVDIALLKQNCFSPHFCTLIFLSSCGWPKSWSSLPMEAELKSMETEFGGNRMVAFILSWQRAEHSRRPLQEPSPSV